MSITSGTPLNDISTYRSSNENQRPTRLMIPSGGSHFIEGTGSEKLALEGIASQHSGPTHDGSSGGGGDDVEGLDRLLSILEAEDEGEIPIKEEILHIGESRNIPDHWLHTDATIGLNVVQVSERRKVYGMNQMKVEKRNPIKQFLMFFVGPIQFVMEVIIDSYP